MKREITHFDELDIQLPPYDYATLKDVVWTPYGDDPEMKDYNASGDNGFLTGTVVKGYTINRIFGCVKRTDWKEGETKTFHFSPITRIRDRKGDQCPVYYNHSV